MSQEKALYSLHKRCLQVSQIPKAIHYAHGCSSLRGRAGNCIRYPYQGKGKAWSTVNKDSDLTCSNLYSPAYPHAMRNMET